LSIASRIRAAYPQIHIIMLTARISESDRIIGYENGADIYMTKPVSVAELEASIGSIARRREEISGAEQKLWLDVISMQLQNGNSFINLTRQETQLLRALNEAPMQFLPAWALLERLGKEADKKNRANLDVSITRLRKKLFAASGQEVTLKVARNSGYQLTIRLRIK
jgi:two-component system phosphate regulon response regulator OmpR